MKNTLDALHYQPSTLLNNEIKDPKDVIVNFFGDSELYQLKATIWELYTAWVNDAVAYARPEDYAKMLDFYMQVSKLFDACYIISEEKPANNGDPNQLPLWAMPSSRM